MSEFKFIQIYIKMSDAIDVVLCLKKSKQKIMDKTKII